VFGRARWRLTLWFAGALTLIIVLIGAAVFFSARRMLFDQVNDDLVARAEREARPLVDRLVQRARDGGPIRNVQIGPNFTAGGYFYAVATANGDVVGSTPNADPAGLAPEDTLTKAVSGGPAFVGTTSSEGEHLRVYIMPLGRGDDPRFVLEVGRSTEPERDALRRLMLILGTGGGAAVILGLGGGFWLAGRALRPIQGAMDKQRAFVADASHELRTPLALIRANAELLERGAEQPVQANMTSVQDIIGETDRLSFLVGQMLTLAQSDAGEANLKREPIDLGAIAEDTVRQMRLLAEPKSISLDFTTRDRVEVSGDETRLRELITILLDNAIKYSDDAASIRVDLNREGGKAVLRVVDNGRGIPQQALPRIFDRFYRADKARSRLTGGAGLGLAIAKWIAESHNGTIAIESGDGRGTTVTVELPAQPQTSF
jgi:two-component system sensor histidine kinase CiaH